MSSVFVRLLLLGPRSMLMSQSTFGMFTGHSKWNQYVSSCGGHQILRHIQQSLLFWNLWHWSAGPHQKKKTVCVNFESSLMWPLLTFLVSWQPLVASVSMAEKEAVRWGGTQSKNICAGGRSSREVEAQDFHLCNGCLCQERNQKVKKKLKVDFFFLFYFLM